MKISFHFLSWKLHVLWYLSTALEPSCFYRQKLLSLLALLATNINRKQRKYYRIFKVQTSKSSTKFYTNNSKKRILIEIYQECVKLWAVIFEQWSAKNSYQIFFWSFFHLYFMRHFQCLICDSFHHLRSFFVRTISQLEGRLSSTLLDTILPVIN